MPFDAHTGDVRDVREQVFGPALRVMLQVGLSVAPSQAHAWTRERAQWRTTARGGEGAARELCDLLLAAQGRAEDLLADIAHVTGVRVEGQS